jgi:proton-coupled amino acid transporter
MSIENNTHGRQRNVIRTGNYNEGLGSGKVFQEDLQETSSEPKPGEDVQPLSGEAPEKAAGATVVQSIFNMSKLFLGISILATPNAFSHAGVLAGAIGILVVTILCIYTIWLQASCRNEIGDRVTSYSELGHCVYGAFGKNSVDFFLLIAQLGIGIAYLIFNGKQLDQVICYETQGSLCGMKNTYIWSACAVLVPIMWIKTLKKLFYVNLFALTCIVACIVTIFYYDIIYILEDEYPDREVKSVDILDMPLFFGVAVLNFEGNPASLNVQASMDKPKKFTTVLLVSTISISVLVVTQGTLSYLAFGHYVEDLITLNLPHNTLTTILRIGYSIGLLLSYPVQLFAGVDIIEHYEFYRNMPSLPWWPDFKYYFFRTSIVLLTGFIAVSIPQFGIFLDFLGAFAGTFLCFIFPVVFYNKVFADKISGGQKVINYTVIVVGGILGMISACRSFAEIMSELFHFE